MSVILGTAGHIDHGKTNLIRALTQIDCDRLQEEKKRGITIDLGFAWMDLDNGDRLGIIDVPGHERFVRTMVAGAFGIDLVLLVIACDEGIMPQTREHLEICTLLGVHRGIIALTKKDLVDSAWIAMVQEECRKEFAKTFLENAPIFPVSSTTMEGISELKAALQAEAKAIPKRQTSDIFRMPIDRVFTIHGHGTVVTGTVVSGSLAVGEKIALMPKGVETRARSLERHEQSVDEIFAGSRCAINLQSLEKKDVSRGEWVTKPGELFPSTRIYALVQSLPSSPIALKQRSELHYHSGTKECAARLVFRDRTKLSPGESAFAEILFDQPLCCVFGDRAVLRTLSPLKTVAGAFVLCPTPPLWAKKDKNCADTLAAWLSLPTYAQKDPKAFLETLLNLIGVPGLSFAHLRVASGYPKKSLEKYLKALLSNATLFQYISQPDTDEKAYIAKNAFEKLCQNAIEKAKEIHEKNPLKPNFSKESLLNFFQTPKRLAQKVIDYLIQQGNLCLEGDGLREQSHTVLLDTKKTNLKEKILQKLSQNPLSPPNCKDILEELNLSEKEANPILSLMIREGSLIKISQNLYYEKKGYTAIMDTIYTWFQNHEELDVSNLKGLLGISRKYLIALLEHMDNAHITVRVGDKRRLRKTK